ncbi:MAG: DUF3854 domain-containing protein [Nitrospira sp.]|nr:DUF3854 domain-containing protein [Nitrospira sp.]
MSLAPEHLADLQKSGLTDSTIEACQIHSVPPYNIKLPKAVESACSYPYFRLDGTLSGLERWKLFPPLVDDDGSIQKYHQPKSTDPELYLPPLPTIPSWQEIASDPTIDLTITEGEKKCLALCQIGVVCIGVSGVWNWRQRLDDEPMVLLGIEGFVWEGRKVELVPDSDVWLPEKFVALCGFYALAQVLKEREAIVTFVRLPGKGKK